MVKQDLHIHSSYSWDCEMNIKEIAQTAIEHKMVRIAITDHVEEKDSVINTILKYQPYGDRAREIEHLRKCIDVLEGIEVSEPYKVVDACVFYKSLPLDFVMGSVHRFQRKLEKEEEIKKEFDEYYLKNLKSVLVSDFEVLGHLGYIERAYPDYEYHNDKLVGNVLNAVIEKGKILEINTSALRRCGKPTIPSFEVLKRYKELGGAYVTIGSDAHKYSEIGDNLETGYEIAEELGLQAVYFKNRKRKI